ncbi:N-acetylmuramoyl-L-alanine amidase [Pedobacter duraquae]|uniref:N-acetylmuramoyl-L-alanine amidase n=1 Tax=Pedobacter duraquae TaxID=425511 RepID=A0A4R6INI6_9SPHI|nr:N-acetylmuramoyl-L-alanine amidase [Pedobacter duraquae]TDO23792.1 N-acetylmuramoyl-L-alanine amidase [Pedobacter duraquae]
MGILIYLAQVSLCSALLYLFYHFLLKRTSFFQENRFFLILALAFSFIVPAIDITFEKAALVNSIQGGPETEQHAFGKIDTGSGVALESTFDLIHTLVLGYWLIAALIFLRGLFAVAVVLIKARGEAEQHGRLKVFYGLKGMGNSSFFNLVFLENAQLSDLQKKVVLTHERIHAEQRHSLDKLLMLLCRSILWANPAIYIYEQELEKLHEFQADILSAAQLGQKAYARSLVDLAKESQSNYPLHALSTHPLKSRLSMLFAPTTIHSLRWRYLFSVPLAIGLMMVFSLKFVYAVPAGTGFVLVVDAGHGGKDAGTTWGNVKEKELVLDIARRISEHGSVAGIKVLLTRNDDSKSTLKERANNRGNLFISLHTDSLAPQVNGIRILVGDKSAVVEKKEQLFTTLLQKQFSLDQGGLKVGNTIVRTPQLYLLRQYTLPSVVLELGNLNNDADRTFLLSASGREAIAENIMGSVENYRRQTKDN